MNLSRAFASFVNTSAQLLGRNGGIAALGIVGTNHQLQQTRQKSIIKFCGYLEIADFKKKDPRWNTNTRHCPKRISWHDYQERKFRAVHRQKPFPLWQARMDMADNLVRLGMPTWTIEKTVGIHPHCVEYLKKKVNGTVRELYPAQYSNYVNHRSGDR